MVGCIEQKFLGDDLLAIAGTILREQMTQPRVVTGGRVKTASAILKTLPSDQPCCIGLRAQGLPQPFFRDVGHCFFGGALEHMA